MDIGKIPRGEDFSNKYAKGEWAEAVLIESVSSQDGLYAFQYGVSHGEALTTEEELNSVKEPGVEEIKRPDILVYTESKLEQLDEESRALIEEYVAANPEEKNDILKQIEESGVVSESEMALEAESSKFHIGNRQASSLSSYVKAEDFPRLKTWRDQYQIPIFVCQLFFDRGYIIPFKYYEKYNEDAREGTVAVSGFEYGEIPKIRKKGLQAKVKDFPHSECLGYFNEEPSVVRNDPDDMREIDYSWSNKGKLEVESEGDEEGLFSGGILSIEDQITDYMD